VSHDDFDFEPQRGLPAALPAGERLLWQGSPDWKSLAIRAYQVRKVAIYFGALIVWRIGAGLLYGQATSVVALTCAGLFALGALAVGILCLLAYASARSAVYSITSKRILLRHGVAVPLTLNLPFKVIESADLKVFADQSGEIAIRTFEDQRVGYMITWPYVRSGHITRTQPSLRALPDAASVAATLASALAASLARTGTVISGTEAVASATSSFAPTMQPAVDLAQAVSHGTSYGPQRVASAQRASAA
jgi:methyl-accepting chemotaxis protein